MISVFLPVRGRYPHDFRNVKEPGPLPSVPYLCVSHHNVQARQSCQLRRYHVRFHHRGRGACDYCSRSGGCKVFLYLPKRTLEMCCSCPLVCKQIGTTAGVPGRNTRSDERWGLHTASWKSYSRCVITLGEAGPVFEKSVIQKIVTKSSTEWELVCLSDNASQVQGYEVGPQWPSTGKVNDPESLS